MLNNKLEIRIAGSSCRPHLFFTTKTVSLAEDILSGKRLHSLTQFTASDIVVNLGFVEFEINLVLTTLRKLTIDHLSYGKAYFYGYTFR